MNDRIRQWLRLQWTDQATVESGQAVTEYGVLLAVLLIAAGAIVTTLEGSISSFIAQVGDKIATILS